VFLCGCLPLCLHALAGEWLLATEDSKERTGGVLIFPPLRGGAAGESFLEERRRHQHRLVRGHLRSVGVLQRGAEPQSGFISVLRVLRDNQPKRCNNDYGSSVRRLLA
jgi:hypothetical protein